MTIKSKKAILNFAKRTIRKREGFVIEVDNFIYICNGAILIKTPKETIEKEDLDTLLSNTSNTFEFIRSYLDLENTREIVIPLPKLKKAREALTKVCSEEEAVECKEVHPLENMFLINANILRIDESKKSSHFDPELILSISDMFEAKKLKLYLGDKKDNGMPYSLMKFEDGTSSAVLCGLLIQKGKEK